MDHSPHCLVCHELSSGRDAALEIFRTPWWRVTLTAEDQRYLGRVYITPWRHLSDITELTPTEYFNFQDVVKTYFRIVRQAFGWATPFNMDCQGNNTYRQSSPQPHLHWHVRPRWAAAPFVLGRHWPDPNFGHAYERTNPLALSPEMLQQLAQLLRNAK